MSRNTSNNKLSADMFSGESGHFYSITLYAQKEKNDSEIAIYCAEI